MQYTIELDDMEDFDRIIKACDDRGLLYVDFFNNLKDLRNKHIKDGTKPIFKRTLDKDDAHVGLLFKELLMDNGYTVPEIIIDKPM